MVEEKKYLDQLIRTLLQTKTRSEMLNLLEGILTPQELLEIPTRLEIVKRLKEGIPQQRIAKDLKVGVATVTRGSKELQKGRFRYV